MSTQPTFADLGLAEPLLRAVADTGYERPTPIQAQAIPQVIQGGDVLAAAQTGTGKTAGFTLPILHRLLQQPATARKPGRPRVLILTPTRELTAQVEESVRTYSQYTQIRSMVMFGGVNINPQISALRKPLDILVATPGRLLDHTQQKTVDLSGVEILVLDEADRMLDMGFIRDIRRVLALLPKTRQNLLFSATFSDEIRELSHTVLKNPIEISVARRNTASELVSQRVVLTEQSHKRDLLSHIIRESGWHQVLVFTRTKHGANRLAEKLVKDGLSAAAIHGNKSQAARTRALAGFKDGKVAVLVATDIAARGIDIDQLPHVVNFELPNVPEDYVHRIGRTGRAGSEGSALSLVDRTEVKLLTAIEKLIKRPIERTTIEGWTPDMVRAEPAQERDAERSGGERRSSAGANGGARRTGNGRGGDENRPRGNGGDERRASAGQGRPEGQRARRPAGQGRPAGARENAPARREHFARTEGAAHATAEARRPGAHSDTMPRAAAEGGRRDNRPSQRPAPQRAALLAK
ncbi:DEAD/DEAH box helicase [Paracandidimonas lactea]|uniref:DEAD/DEAH box helicase n=1 Tax=Paracandidimonas lactea TaxID=2895524 RepID=UPI001F000275|nr:DEAD/DEAH box helicase [Paracandidimonas lactea]